MTKIQEFFSEAIEVRSYSGRGMYGKSCLAITGSLRECQRAVANVVGVLIDEIVDAEADLNDDSLSDAIRNAADITVTTNRKLIEQLIATQQSDSMGMGTVMYWPNFTFEADETVDEDEE